MSARSRPGRVISPVELTFAGMEDLRVVLLSLPWKQTDVSVTVMRIPAQIGWAGLAGIPDATETTASARVLRSTMNSNLQVSRVVFVYQVEDLPAVIAADGGVRLAVIAPHLRVLPGMVAVS